MKYSIQLFGVAALCALLASACSESTTAGEPDLGGITFDAGPDLGGPDLGPDLAGPPGGGNVGAACETTTDCTGIAQCAPEPDFPGGYCTIDCTADDCPTGSACTPVGRDSAICLDECDPAAATRECRTGYGCANTMGGASVCIPGCTDDTDCADGTVCDTTANGGACYTEGSAIGDACLDSAMCTAGGFCYAEDFQGWPGGACSEFGCDPTDGTGCPAGAICGPGFRGNGLCFAACMLDTECRTGYRCAVNPGVPGTKFCAPILNAADVGQACSGRDGVACAGGNCLREIDTGYPGSYCAQNVCTPGAAVSDCPGDSVCVLDGATSRCLDSCTLPTDCRAGYGCLPVDGTAPAGPLYCKPACTLDAQCVNMGSTCNLTTGLCVAAPPAP